MISEEPVPARDDWRGAERARRQLTTSLGWNLVSELAARGASLWMALFCARIFSVESFGVLAFGLVAIQYAWLLGDAAMNGGYAARELARPRAGESRLADLFMTSRMGAGAGLCLIVFSLVAVLPMASDLRQVLLVGSIYLLAYAAFPDWAARGSSNFRSLALANLAGAAFLVTAIAVLLPSRPHPAAAMGTWVTSFLVASLVLVWLLHRGRVLRWRPHFSKLAWRTHVRRSLVFSVGSLLGVGILQLPTIELGLLTGAREVGLFSAAFRPIVAVLGAIAILWWPLFPLLSRETVGSPAFRTAFTGATALALGTAVPATAAFVFFPREILVLLFGLSYGSASPALQICAWALPLNAVAGLLEQVILATGREMDRVRAYAVGLVTMLVTGSLLMPAHGVAGASIALVTGLVVSVLLYVWRLRGTSVLADLTRAGKPVVYAGCLLAAAWCASVLGPRELQWAPLLGGAGCYAMVVIRAVWAIFRPRSLASEVTA